MKDTLADLLDYDLWANRQWLSAPLPEDLQQLLTDQLRHVEQAQRIWLARCLSEEDAGEALDDLDTALEKNHTGWKELIRICDLTAYISYTTRKGDSFFNSVQEVAFHVVNHGTYHRGVLRGACLAAGFEDFPETDLILHYRDSGK